MVGEKEAQVTSWWVVIHDLWVNGLALLTFDLSCLVSSSTSSELSFVRLREGSAHADNTANSLW